VFGALLATPVVAALWVVVASIYRSARGESADQILARKRAPWALRRPRGHTIRGSGGQEVSDDGRTISQPLEGDATDDSDLVQSIAQGGKQPSQDLVTDEPVRGKDVE
jgi:hypothetical protein